MAWAPWRKTVVERVPVCGGDSTHESPRTNHPLSDDCTTPRPRHGGPLGLSVRIAA